jgi:hypothetical protein
MLRTLHNIIEKHKQPVGARPQTRINQKWLRTLQNREAQTGHTSMPLRIKWLGSALPDDCCVVSLHPNKNNRLRVRRLTQSGDNMKAGRRNNLRLPAPQTTVK